MKRFTAALATLLSFTVFALAADTPPTGSFKPDTEGFILNWLLLEPITLNNIQHTEAGIKQILAADYVKDQLTTLPKDGDQLSIDGALYQWHAFSSKDYLVNLVAFAAAHQKPVINELFWGIAYITLPEEMKDARLAIGSDDDSVWWVNGKQVIAAYGIRQTSTDDNVSKRLLLKKGLNIIRFAVIQGDGPSDCCARFYDARQKIITNLTISLDPPASLEKAAQ